MIKANQLVKVFRTNEVETPALNRVNIQIREGEFIAIMGPSGCGKSTLLNILGLIDQPSGGELYFDGMDVTQMDERRRTQLRKENIGFVFQGFNLIDELTVYENIELPLLYNKTPLKERKYLINKVLEKMQITHRSKYFPQQLSGGIQQRVAIGRAIVGNPRLILADEPTGNLDSIRSDEIMNLLTALNDEGTTVVMVTHSTHDAHFGHRVIQLFDGHIVTENIRNG